MLASRVAQHLVRLSQGLKLCGGLGVVRVFVRVDLRSATHSCPQSLPHLTGLYVVCFLDLFCGRFRADIQHFIQLKILHHVGAGVYVKRGCCTMVETLRTVECFCPIAATDAKELCNKLQRFVTLRRLLRA